MEYAGDMYNYLHEYIYIYIYIYRERERERERLLICLIQFLSKRINNNLI